VVSPNLGELGPCNNKTVVVQSPWYYSLLGFADWALIGALLVLVKENRSWQAWTILLPFGLLSEILRPWTERILSWFSTQAAQFDSLAGLVVFGPNWDGYMPYGEQYDFPFQWLVVAWTVVWLLSPWLARCRPLPAFVLAMGLAAILGVMDQFGVYQRLHFSQPLINYLISIFALLLAFALSGLSCRNTYRPGRFLAWLLTWLIVGVAVGLICELGWLYAYLSRRSSAPPVSFLQLRLISFSICIAAVLYLLNLPFMVLSFRCPTYRDRFYRLLRLPEYTANETTPSDACTGREYELP
jgi:hypothetical protein